LLPRPLLLPLILLLLLVLTPPPAQVRLCCLLGVVNEFFICTSYRTLNTIGGPKHPEHREHGLLFVCVVIALLCLQCRMYLQELPQRQAERGDADRIVALGGGGGDEEQQELEQPELDACSLDASGMPAAFGAAACNQPCAFTAALSSFRGRRSWSEMESLGGGEAKL